jgi:hypothetical protein
MELGILSTNVFRLYLVGPFAFAIFATADVLHGIKGTNNEPQLNISH